MNEKEYEGFREEVLEVVLNTLNKPTRMLLEPHIHRHVKEHPELTNQIRQLVYKHLAEKPCSRCGQPAGYPSMLVLAREGEEYRYCRACMESLFHAYEFLQSLIGMWRIIEAKRGGVEG